MLRISSVIMLYNSKMSASETLQSILEATLDGICLTINVWNNGPRPLDEEDVKSCLSRVQGKNIRLNVFEDCRNVALSKIYNFFIDKADYDFFIILDQDSKLEADFFSNILHNKEYALICPAVYITSKPDVQECPIYHSSGAAVISPTFMTDDVIAISSGLALSSTFIRNVKDKFNMVFNENFAFYDIDIELFTARLKKVKPMQGACVGRMMHDLTGKVEFADMSPRVKQEVGYGKALRKIYISGKSPRSVIVSTVKQIFRHGYGFRAGISLLKCVLMKMHPRSVYLIDSEILPLYTTDITT